MQNYREALSAVMDGDFDSEAGSKLGRIAADEQASATWSRYHLIGDVMRDALIDVAPVEFSERLHNTIAQEPTVLAPPRQSRPLLRPAVAGFAIAASVAAIAVIGITQMTAEHGIANSPEIATATAAPNEALPASPGRVVETPVAMDELQESLQSHRRMNSYLVKFNEQRSSLGVPGANPYVRIVGFESD